MDSHTQHSSIILFDGVCNFCNASVDMIMRNDPKANYSFASLQSEVAQELLKNVNYQDDGPDTLILVEKDSVFVRSTAVLRIASKLRFPFPILRIGFILPSPIRDGLYKWIARNRYKWFGKKDTCRIPTKEEAARFLA